MYAWIWRRLPLGLPGKLTGTLVLLGLAGALLWYVVFPWAEPLLPFDDVQVGDPASGYVSDEHDLPYSTESGAPRPTSPGPTQTR